MQRQVLINLNEAKLLNTHFPQRIRMKRVWAAGGRFKDVSVIGRHGQTLIVMYLKSNVKLIMHENTCPKKAYFSDRLSPQADRLFGNIWKRFGRQVRQRRKGTRRR